MFLTFTGLIGFDIAIRITAPDNFTMSTIAEIQRAIESLPREEQEALAAWMESRTEPVLTPTEEELPLAPLDEASAQLKSGKGVLCKMCD
jgi:hypothetical protein